MDCSMVRVLRFITVSEMPVMPASVSMRSRMQLRKSACTTSVRMPVIFMRRGLRFYPPGLRIPLQPAALPERIHGHAQHDIGRLPGFHRCVRILARADALQKIPYVRRSRAVEAARLALVHAGLHLDGIALRIQRVPFPPHVETRLGAVELLELVVEGVVSHGL